MLLPWPASAADPDTLDSGFEFELSLGWGEALSTDLDSGPIDTSFDLDDSRVLGLAALYRLDSHWAVGIEFIDDQARLDAFDPLPVTGDVTFESLMANGEYRFGSDRLRPFVGVGLGWGRLSSDASAGTLDFDDNGDFFMAQAMAGVRYRILDTVSLMAQLRYRYADDAELRVTDRLTIPLDDEKFLVLFGANMAF